MDAFYNFVWWAWYLASHNKVVVGAVGGAVAALWTDYRVFVTWKTFTQAESYDWRTAGMRLLQGIIAGALTGAGITVVS